MIHKLKKLSEIWQYTAPLKKRVFLKLGNTFLKTRKKKKKKLHCSEEFKCQISR